MTTRVTAVSRCHVCASPQREEADRLLVSGAFHRAVARVVGVSRHEVDRHAAAHLSPALHAAALSASLPPRVTLAEARSLLDRISAMADDAEAILETAKTTGKASLALSAIRELRESLKLLGVASGDLRPDGQVIVQTLNVLSDPGMVAVMAALDRILTPGQRLELAEALGRLDSPRLVGSS